MQMIVPEGTDKQVLPDEDEALAPLTRALVRAAFNDDQWTQILDSFNLVSLVATLKRIVADIGQEQARRAAGLSVFKNDPDVTTEQFRGYKANYLAWYRSSTRVKEKLRFRINEMQPRAQAIINAHNADRRALVILAKRIWLWEEGLEDRLDYALDEVAISWTADDGYQERRPLRALIDDIRKRDGEVTP